MRLLSLLLCSAVIGLTSISPISFADSEKTSPRVSIDDFTNRLNAFETRKTTLDQLLLDPPAELEDTLIAVLKDQGESIPMRYTAVDGLEKLDSRTVVSKLKRILFDRYEADSFIRQACFSILWKISKKEDKDNLLPQLRLLMQNSNELTELRAFLIGRLGQSGYQNAADLVWVEKIIRNKNETSPVRTSCLGFLERNGLEKLALILSDVIKNSTDNSEFRQIATLQMKRLFPDSVNPVLKTVLASRAEPYELRKLCLNLLQNDENPSDLVLFLKQILQKENDSEMRTLLEESIVLAGEK